MANLTEEELEEHVAKAVTAERERCMRLCIMRAEISRASAKRMRAAGTYTVRAVWPPFKLAERVAPRWEEAAIESDNVARAFDVVATCISRGYDPATINDPSATVNLDRWRKAEIGGAHEI